METTREPKVSVTDIEKPKQTKRTAASRSKSRRAASQELFDMIQQDIPDIAKEIMKIEKMAEEVYGKAATKTATKKGPKTVKQIRALRTPDNRYPGLSQEGCL